MTFSDFLNENGIDFLPVFDGNIHRFKGKSSKSESGWYCGHKENDIEILIVGDWVDGNQYKKWTNKGKHLRSEEFKKFMDDLRAKVSKEKELAQASAGIAAVNHLKNNKINIGIEQFKYCLDKKISSIYSAEFCEDQNGAHIAIPITDGEKITSIQKIYSNGEKRFLPGGKIQGCYFLIGEIKDKVYICEGFATGVSIHEATCAAVVVAFNAGNLDAVIDKIKKKHKSAHIVLCADNDKYSEKNTGLDYAKKCKINHGIDYVYPVFGSEYDDKFPTDYNDLFVLCGIDSVKKSLALNVEKKAEFVSNEFQEYSRIFNLIYPTAKKCILTGDIVYLDNGRRFPVINEVNSIKSKCSISGLNSAKVEMHLAHWMQNLKPELLCEIKNHDDKKDYISDVLNHVSVENIEHKYFVELMKWWLAGIFYRFYDNTYQNRMVILSGGQGAGKDTLISNMLKALDPYFVNSNILDKDAENYGIMASSLVVNISEFDRTSKLHVSQLKNIITANGAKFRAPYARTAVNVNFHTSFISSCNIDDVFRDDTGNRRFMFFKISDIDWNYPKGISPEIIAQAKHLADIGYKPSQDALDALDVVINEMTPDSWEELAAEIWETEANDLLKFKFKEKLAFNDCAEIFSKISFNLGVSQRMVQSFIKKNYQVRTKFERYYLPKKPKLEFTRSVN